MKLKYSQQIFEKYSNIKVHKNPSSGSQVVSCGRTEGQTDRQTDMTKLIVAVLNFANTPNQMFEMQCIRHLDNVKIPEQWIKIRELQNCTNYDYGYGYNVGEVCTAISRLRRIPQVSSSTSDQTRGTLFVIFLNLFRKISPVC
jgi:hypothetical protein